MAGWPEEKTFRKEDAGRCPSPFRTVVSEGGENVVGVTVFRIGREGGGVTGEIISAVGAAGWDAAKIGDRAGREGVAVNVGGKGAICILGNKDGGRGVIRTVCPACKGGRG